MAEKPWIKEAGAWPAAAGCLAALLCASILSIDPFGLATVARERAFDLLYLAFPRHGGDANVLVVDIDRATLARLGAWPLPRSHLKSLLDALAKGRPAAVAFDIFFASADRHSPRALVGELEALPGGENVKTLAADMPDTDADFADRLSTLPSILGALAAPGSSASDFNPIRVIGRLDENQASAIEGVSEPYRPLTEAALGLGILSLFGEEEGLVRRVPLLLAADGKIVPGLALEATRIAGGTAVLQPDGATSSLRLGTHNVALDEGGTMRIHWSEPVRWPRRTVSAIDVLDGKIAAARFTDAVVLIGSSLPEAGSLWPTARDPLTPSVQIEAEAVEELRAGTAPHLAPHAWLLVGAATLLFGLLGTWLALVLGPILGSLAQFALIALWLLAAIGTFLASQMLVDPVGPVVASVISGNITAASAFARTRRMKRLIGQRFEQYLAPDLVRAIVARPDRLKREGELREVTALFTDIEGFTGLVTRIGPQEVVRLLDAYFDGICRVITRHGGMIDLIVGDAVHAFFNMPLDVPNHAGRALDCALAIHAFSEEFRAGVKASGFGRTRIGIETGMAVVGDVGGPGRFNYTAHGAVANAAARLEAANKEFGSVVCIGPGTAAAVDPDRLEKIGETALRGFAAPVDVYTIKNCKITVPTPAPSGSVPHPILSRASAPRREI